MSLEFSPRQQRAMTSALTLLSVAVILAACGVIVWLLGSFLRAFSGVLLPLAVAGILALVVRPYYDFFALRLRWPVGLAVAAIFLSVLVPVVAVGFFFGAVVAGQLSGLVENVPVWAEAGRDWVTERSPVLAEAWERYGLQGRLSAALEGKGAAIVAGLQTVGGRALDVGSVVLGFFGGLFSWAILPVYFAFFLIVKPRTRLSDVALPFLRPETREDVVYLVREFLNIIVAFFRGQLLVALMQGLLLAVGFALTGLRYGFVLGLLLGFLNVIPYLGSMVGLAVCLPLGFFQDGGGMSTVAWVIVVFVAVQIIEGYVLTPRVMGDKTGLHPMAIIFSIFFWGAALQGILGMILAIPLTAFLVVFWRLAREKYIGELV